MQLSVIIPVYNAERFIQHAVTSALAQDETGEVVLVEDGSPDNSLQICLEMAEKEDRVRLFRHPGGQNRGAGASRNLGVAKARFDWIAFLDADDYYLPGRFSTASTLLDMQPNVDGVYEAIGMHYYSERAKDQWIRKEGDGLTGLTTSVPPGALFETLVQSGNGYIHLDGLVVRKTCILQSGLFPPHLRLHQDTALIFQVAMCGKLIAGRLDMPVALRGIHDSNRILSTYDVFYTRFLFWQYMLFWCMRRSISNQYRKIIIKKTLLAFLHLMRSKLRLI